MSIALRPSSCAVFAVLAFALGCSTAATSTATAPSDATSSDAATTADAAATDTAASGETASYTAYVTAFVNANCDRDIRCTKPNKYATIEACVADLPATLTLQRKHIGESVTAGKTSYDAAQAKVCLDAVRGPCSTPSLDVLKACNPVVDGKVALGESCIGHFECLDVPTKGYGPYCFEGCNGLFGDQDPAPTGKCVAESPIGTPACKE